MMTPRLLVGSGGLCLLAVVLFVAACSEDAKDPNATGSSSSGSSGGVGAGSSGTSGGGAQGAAGYGASLKDRCKHVCGKYDASRVGSDYLQCGPEMFANAPGQYECADLCDSINPDPKSEFACAAKLGQFIDCAYPEACAATFIPGGGRVPNTCYVLTCKDSIEPCSPSGVSEACADQYGGFLSSHGISPDAGAKKNAQVECNKVCQKKAAAMCPQSNCDLGCALFSQTTRICQDAEITATECILSAPDVCKPTECSAKIEAQVKACM